MAGPTQKELEVLVSELEVRTERLRKLYDQYFLGFEKLEPTVARKDVDRRIDVIRKEQLRNTALRFRFQMITQKYSTYQTLWARTCRAIEEGTFKRHLAKARARFGTPGAVEADLGIDVDLEDFEDLEAQVAADMEAIEAGEAGADDATSAGPAPAGATLDDVDRPPPGSSWRPKVDAPAPVVNVPAGAPPPAIVRAFNPTVQPQDASSASRRIVRRAPPVELRAAERAPDAARQSPAGLDLSDPFESQPPRDRTPRPLESPGRATPPGRPMIRPRAPAGAAEPTPSPQPSPVRREERIVRRPPPTEARKDDRPKPAPVDATPAPAPAPARREERIVRPPPPVEPPREAAPVRREERIVRPPPPVEARPAPAQREQRIVRPPPPAAEPRKAAPTPPKSAPDIAKAEPAKPAAEPPKPVAEPPKPASPPAKVVAPPPKPIKPLPLPSSLRGPPKPLGADNSRKKDGDG